jgi:DNA-binding winged helix-turn-helix (wHTH) protein/tetratricopeptide (TPR) repeat protein
LFLNRCQVSRSPRRRYTFGAFRFEVADLCLYRHGRLVPLTPKAAATLRVLLEHRGETVTKRRLLETVWPDSFVGDGVLSVNVFALRKALGSTGGQDGYIVTVPRRGYRFVGDVEERLEDDAAPAVAPAAPMEAARPLSSLAVLPFKTLAGDQVDYLGLSLADALVARLSKLPRLLVRPTSSVRNYVSLDQDAQSVGRELLVDAVLEGTLRHGEGRLRILVQLVDARRGVALWAEQFDEASADLFSIEDRLCDAVSHALLHRLSHDERVRLGRRPTMDPRAYQLYLRGRYFWSQRKPSTLQRGIACFQEALAIDPDFALAWAGLADSELLGATAVAPREAMPRARRAAERALALDADLAEAHASLGRIQMSFDWDWRGAERSFAHALDRNPHYATARQWRANLWLAQGRIDDAEAEMERAHAIEPFSLILRCARGWVQLMARRPDRALEHYRTVLEMEPRFLMAQREVAFVYEQLGGYDEALRATELSTSLGDESPFVLGARGRALARMGRAAEARAMLGRLEASRAGGYVPSQAFAILHEALGDSTAALRELRLACDEKASPLIWIKVDPWLDRLRPEPAFSEILERVGLDAVP